MKRHISRLLMAVFLAICVPTLGIAPAIAQQQALVSTGAITTQNLTPTGDATAGSAVSLIVTDRGGVNIQITGTYTGALSVQVSSDNTWVTKSDSSIVSASDGTSASTIPSGATGIWYIPVHGSSRFRVTALGAFTGTANVILRTTSFAVSRDTVSVTNWPATQAVSAAALPLPSGAATESTLAALSTKTPLGSALAASSRPVVMATDASPLPDLTITGAGSQLALNQNVLLASAGTGAVDASGYRSVAMHVVTGAGTVTGGILRMEQSNDNVNWVNVYVANLTNVTADYGASSPQIAPTASMNSLYVSPIVGRYVRLRISTGLTGTTTGVQVISHFKSAALEFPPYQSALSINSLPTLGTVTTITTANTQAKASTATNATLSSAATTNATSVKTSSGQLFAVSASNTGGAVAFLKLYNKASAPTVGTDVPVLTIPIPASGVVVLPFGTQGQIFNVGIAFAITNLVADSDTTAVSAAQVKVMLSYI